MNANKVINGSMTALVLTGALFCVLFALVIAYWAVDRDVPFTLESYAVEPVKAGTTTTVRAKVKRDLDRRCSVVFSRTFYDASGVRYELTEGVQFMNALALDAYNERSPDMLAFSVKVPPSATPGKGSVMTALNYECNPIHQFFPISTVLEMNLEVLPP